MSAIQLTVMTIDFNSFEEPVTKVFDKEEVTLGRMPGNDLVLDRPEVSAYHARLVLRKNGNGEDKLYVTDLGSTSGTQLERETLSPDVEIPVGPNQRLIIGSFLVKPLVVKRPERQLDTQVKIQEKKIQERQIQDKLQADNLETLAESIEVTTSEFTLGEIGEIAASQTVKETAGENEKVNEKVVNEKVKVEQPAYSAPQSSAPFKMPLREDGPVWVDRLKPSAKPAAATTVAATKPVQAKIPAGAPRREAPLGPKTFQGPASVSSKFAGASPVGRQMKPASFVVNKGASAAPAYAELLREGQKYESQRYESQKESPRESQKTGDLGQPSTVASPVSRNKTMASSVAVAEYVEESKPVFAPLKDSELMGEERGGEFKFKTAGSFTAANEKRLAAVESMIEKENNELTNGNGTNKGKFVMSEEVVNGKEAEASVVATSTRWQSVESGVLKESTAVQLGTVDTANTGSAEVLDAAARSVSPEEALTTLAPDADIMDLCIEAEQLFSLSGRVVCKGEPLAAVVVDGQALGRTETGADGKFMFEDVVEGTNYRLVLSKPGYVLEPAVLSGMVENDAALRVNAVKLFTLSGRVLHKGVALAGVRIDGGALGVTTTQTDGSFSFHDVRDGTPYQLQASKDRYSFSCPNISGVVDKDIQLSFSSRQLLTISGRVVHKGQPLAGVEVECVSLGRVKTDANGVYTFENVPEGAEYKFVANKPGFRFSVTKTL